MDLGCIYYIYCKETNKGYVGLSQYPTPDKRYADHWNRMKYDNTKYLYKAMKKYGQDSFTVELLCTVRHEALSRMEAYWAEQLETYRWDHPGGYNMVWCGDVPRIGLHASNETKLKMKESALNMSEEKRKNISEASKTKIISEEARKKISEANKNKIISEEHRLANSKANRHPKSDETKSKMSNSAKNRSEEHRHKISEALKARYALKRQNQIKQEQLVIKSEQPVINKIKVPELSALGSAPDGQALQ